MARTSASRPSSSRIESVGPDELERDSAWWDLYREAFAAEAREPREVILRSLREGVGLAVRARAEGRTVGLATTHLLQRPASVFLVYLAVEPRRRGRGLGRALLEFAWAASAAGLRDPLGMIWEVDAPLAPGAMPTEEYRRRIGFYERSGGSLLAQRYAQPPVDGRTTLPLQLMFRPVKEGSLPDTATSQALVRAMYEEKYHGLNGIPDAVLARLAAEIGVAPDL